MKKIILLFLMFFGFTLYIFANYPQTDVQQIYDTASYREFIYYMYNSPSETKLDYNVESINTFIESSTFTNEAKTIAKTQILQLIGKFLIKNRTTLKGKNGKTITEEGFQEIANIKNIEKNEEALIVKANLLGNFTLLSNSYKISKGLEAGRVIDQAIRINNNNPRSIIIDCERMIYAPRLFGGDKEKAKKQLKALIENFQLLPKDAFEAIKDLGIIAKNEGNEKFAKIYFTYAKNIFPDNQDINELLCK